MKLNGFFMNDGKTAAGSDGMSATGMMDMDGLGYMERHMEGNKEGIMNAYTGRIEIEGFDVTAEVAKAMAEGRSAILVDDMTGRTAAYGDCSDGFGMVAVDLLRGVVGYRPEMVRYDDGRKVAVFLSDGNFDECTSRMELLTAIGESSPALCVAAGIQAIADVMAPATEAYADPAYDDPDDVDRVADMVLRGDLEKDEAVYLVTDGLRSYDEQSTLGLMSNVMRLHIYGALNRCEAREYMAKLAARDATLTYMMSH